MRVLILHDDVASDARADELDVLVQADAVAAALHALGHETERMPFGLDLAAAACGIDRRAPDVVVNLVESVARRGRWIHFAPALLDGLGVPYTGNPTEAVFTTSNKLCAKAMLVAAELPTPAWRSRVDLERDGRSLPGAWIVKSVWEHGSVGLDEDSVFDAADARALAAAIDARCLPFGGDGFAEQYVDGREFNLSLLETPDGVVVLPPAEIRFVGFGGDRRRVVGWRAKWATGSFEFENTPRTFEFAEGDRPLLAELERLACAAWGHFGLRGYARVDFRVDRAGRPFILEVNTNPCLSPDAGYAAALDRAGIGLGSAIRDLLAAATSSHRPRHVPDPADL